MFSDFFSMYPFEYWTEIFTIFFLSTVKFGFGLISAVYFEVEKPHAFIANILGGALGVYLYTFFGSIIKKTYLSIRYKKTTPKKFSKWNRAMIHFRKRFGMLGIALLSPVLLSIPVGVILAIQITNSKLKIFLFMFSGCLFWSLIFFLVVRN